MHEIIEVDRACQRLGTYSVGHKQGIHPAKLNDENWLCCVFAWSAVMQPSLGVESLSTASSSCKHTTHAQSGRTV